MKKLVWTFWILLMSGIIFFLSFDYKQKQDPNTYYRVYLKSEVIGVIRSKEELENYINNQNRGYQKKYNVSQVNIPNGLEIKKITTYRDKVDSVKKIYEKIVDKEPFTIPGYEFNMKKGDKKTTIYVLEKSVFNTAVETAEKTFVGTEDYNAYKENIQTAIQTTGKVIEDIYVEDQITTKSVNIPVDEKIYTDENELSRFLIFGPNDQQTVHTVKVGETITDVAFVNKISPEELLISNPSFTSEKNLLFPGQKIVIRATDPQLSVVTISYVVEDRTVKYQTDFQYDANAVKGDDKVTQVGEDGLERINQSIISVNGSIDTIEIKKKEQLKPVINEIVIKGEKDIPSVGSKTNWFWPVRNSGWVISSPFGYRWSAYDGASGLHTGLDIAGTGWGSQIYAVTNGVVIEAGWKNANGNYVCINHNNGYYTCYNHMSKILTKVGSIVGRGDTIGLVGQTGAASGPHLHLEVWTAYPWRYGTGTLINPTKMYPQYFR